MLPRDDNNILHIGILSAARNGCFRQIDAFVDSRVNDFLLFLTVKFLKVSREGAVLEGQIIRWLHCFSCQIVARIEVNLWNCINVFKVASALRLRQWPLLRNLIGNDAAVLIFNGGEGSCSDCRVIVHDLKFDHSIHLRPFKVKYCVVSRVIDVLTNRTDLRVLPEN